MYQQIYKSKIVVDPSFNKGLFLEELSFEYLCTT